MTRDPASGRRAVHAADRPRHAPVRAAEFVRTPPHLRLRHARRADGPAMSVVYYVPTDTDELLVSTMRDRGKAKAVARDAKVSLCVLDERWPFSYLQVYCDASVDDDPELVVDVMMAVAGRMSGEPLAEDARPFVAAMAEEESASCSAAGPTPPSPSRPGTSTRTTRPNRSPTGSRLRCPGTPPTPATPRGQGCQRAARRPVSVARPLATMFARSSTTSQTLTFMAAVTPPSRCQKAMSSGGARLPGRRPRRRVACRRCTPGRGRTGPRRSRAAAVGLVPADGVAPAAVPWFRALAQCSTRSVAVVGVEGGGDVSCGVHAGVAGRRCSSTTIPLSTSRPAARASSMRG